MKILQFPQKKEESKMFFLSDRKKIPYSLEKTLKKMESCSVFDFLQEKQERENKVVSLFKKRDRNER